VWTWRARSRATDSRRRTSRGFEARSCTSCAKEDEEPGRGGSQPSRDPESMRTTSTRPTKIEVVQERRTKKNRRPSSGPRKTHGHSLHTAGISLPLADPPSLPNGTPVSTPTPLEGIARTHQVSFRHLFFCSFKKNCSTITPRRGGVGVGGEETSDQAVADGIPAVDPEGLSGHSSKGRNWNSARP